MTRPILGKIRDHLSDIYLKDDDPVIAKAFSKFKNKNDSEEKRLVRELIKEQYTLVLRQIVHTANVGYGFGSAADPMVYPIIFCARHSIELCLKWLVRCICHIKILKENKPAFNHKTATKEDLKKHSALLENKLKIMKIDTKTKTHDIKTLRDLICKYYEIDANIKKYFDIVSPCLCDYFLDPAGDVFRYWNDKDGTPNLENRDIRLISLDIFKEKYDIIYNKLMELSYFASSVREAIRCTNTFTKKLSRWQIEEISKKLPQKNTWENKLETVRQQVMGEYCLSSTDFSEALEIIKNHREFCVNIGMEIQFGNFSDSSIANYVQYVKGEIDENKICDLLSFDDYILLLTFSEMSESVPDIHGNLYFPEELESVYAHYRSRLQEPQSFDYVRLKKNHEKIIKGMKRCGQLTYLNKLQI